ncbi:FYVE zinc finger-domain-containing protein [Desarmillaria tabescens]|uniref:FYVE zinc finger-domain-containing protein n=1 Tax=Armillaria tabescens TaxID=1929756 RepID=A0AA39JQY1_ARMTA|nr:FYVE zinc finger-domain-containing protein [Desarmillaria tabescens]KAK0444943.1 FYVE zinc finger-domain-containing protein [Desarmillaria tabescens]
MSALAAALATFSVPSPSNVVDNIPDDHLITPMPVAGPSRPVLPETPIEIPTVSPNLRANEHLAVLLPRYLWKNDSAASCCDNFFCRVRFSVFERRHHCRKCGGVFCSQCTPRTTPLLDTSRLPFLHPPRNIYDARVCDDCFDQIYGCPRTPDLVHSPALSCSTSSLATPPPSIIGVERSLRSSPSLVSLACSSCSSGSRRRLKVSLAEEPSYGALDAYPLKRSSVLCKATGGGRWEPKQETPLAGARLPGGKAGYEIRLEKEAEKEKRRRENPVIKDGDFQYRFPRDPELVDLQVRQICLSTF